MAQGWHPERWRSFFARTLSVPVDLFTQRNPATWRRSVVVNDSWIDHTETRTKLSLLSHLRPLSVCGTHRSKMTLSFRSLMRSCKPVLKLSQSPFAFTTQWRGGGASIATNDVKNAHGSMDDRPNPSYSRSRRFTAIFERSRVESALDDLSSHRIKKGISKQYWKSRSWPLMKDDPFMLRPACDAAGNLITRGEMHHNDVRRVGMGGERFLWWVWYGEREGEGKEKGSEKMMPVSFVVLAAGAAAYYPRNAWVM
ncbi:hypothetical protein F4604DRAFT_1902204 [Suillus subluteus]|nr:hypothetical protein F4604DRAFT_1902204 [Suillus subluteus]